MSKRPVKDIVKDDVRASQVPAQWEECGQNAGLILWHGFSGFLGNPAQRLCHAVIWFCRRPGCGFRIKWMNPNTKSTLKSMPSQLEPRQLLTSQPVSPWGICGVLWFCSKKKKREKFLVFDWSNRFFLFWEKSLFLGPHNASSIFSTWPRRKAGTLSCLCDYIMHPQWKALTQLIVHQAAGHTSEFIEASFCLLRAYSLKMVLYD